ncbi:MAG: SulP family inorganic anion transporter, partial [Verrucomicrobiota bacterium]
MSDSHSNEELRQSSLKAFLGGLDLFPLRKTTKGYNSSAIAADSRAALNVALLAFPQGIAYAAIAGLPISYGIFGSALASTVGMFFAGSKFIVLGPTNATSVAVFTTFAALSATVSPDPATIALLICLVGIILVVGAYIRLASLIQYISRTVITGYITAAAMLIIINQVRKTLGFDLLPEEKTDASKFVYAFYYTAKHLDDTQWPALLLSIVTAGIFILFNRFFKRLPNVAITLVLSSLFAYFAQKYIDGFNVQLLQG